MLEKGCDPLPGAGRPAGATTSTRIPKYVQRTVIKQLTERAKEGDVTATDTLALLMLNGYGSLRVEL